MTKLIVVATLATAIGLASPTLAEIVAPSAPANIAAAAAPVTAEHAAIAGKVTAPARPLTTLERGPDMSNVLTVGQANDAWDSYIARNFPTVSN